MSFTGLSNSEVRERLLRFGPNEISEVMRVSVLKIFLRQVVSNLLVYILLIAIILSVLVGKIITAYTVGIVLFLAVGTSFIQEYRAEKAIKALKTMIVPVCVVIRDGKQVEVKTSELVPGDIVLLRRGEKVPADCIVRESNNLGLDESILTGESLEVSKVPVSNSTSISDSNRLFMGTIIVNGKSIVEVTHTGMNTRFGKIAGLISTAEKELPLRNKVNDIVRFMIIVAVTISILTGVLLFFRAEELTSSLLVDIIIVVIAVAVAAFPEGFPVVLTTTLALGAKRMAEKNAIVNRMSIIETLGETTVICSDKTGTLTKGEMTVKQIFTLNKQIDVTGIGYEGHGKLLHNGKEVRLESDSCLKRLVYAGVVCNDALIERTGEDGAFAVHGSPTESALLVLGAKAGVFKDDLRGERVEEIPFSSERKAMTVLYKEKEDFIVYENGAPDILINKCEFALKGDSIIRMTPKIKKYFLDKQFLMAKKGYRVLGFSFSNSKKLSPSEKVRGLVFLGITGLEDPPREEVMESIRACFRAGIKVKMITGDYKETALAIANQVGINGKLLTGTEIDDLSDRELEEVVQGINIFARVRPEHKLRIVKALKKKGEIVAMTGDGVNDAPALKEAHIGVAMGKNGTDVSREASDLILKDDNFSTIVHAIEEGRTIYTNVRKFVTYQLSCTIAELTIIFGALLIGLPLPLLAMQILLMNIVTSDIPAITLGMNPSSRDVMHLKPRKKSALLDFDSIKITLIAAGVMGGVTLLVFWVSLSVFGLGLDASRTIALLVLILIEIANAFNFRSFRFGVLQLPITSNKYLVYASIASIIITWLVIYTPLHELFQTVPVSVGYWLFAGLVSLSVVLVLDFYKKSIIKKKDEVLLTMR